jgi:hypothetical protein
MENSGAKRLKKENTLLTLELSILLAHLQEKNYTKTIDYVRSSA